MKRKIPIAKFTKEIIEPKGVEKFCHQCWHWKLLKEFRLFGMSGDRIATMHSNRCIICEDVFGYEYIKQESMYRETVKANSHDDEWQCMFVGNKPYKEICKIFKITDDEK